MSPDVASTRSLMDKLGVRPSSKVAVIDLSDVTFLQQLRERTPDVRLRRPRTACDLIFLGVTTHADLQKIKSLKPLIEPNGAIWVVRPKGGRSELRDTDVIDAGLAAGLVDNKIASFSDTHAAMRLVYRLKDRPR